MVELDGEMDLAGFPGNATHTTLNSRTKLVICIIDFREISSGHQIGLYRQELAWVSGSQDARNYHIGNSTFSCSNILGDPSPAICSARFQSSIYAQ